MLYRVSLHTHSCLICLIGWDIPVVTTDKKPKREDERVECRSSLGYSLVVGDSRWLDWVGCATVSKETRIGRDLPDQMPSA